MGSNLNPEESQQPVEAQPPRKAPNAKESKAQRLEKEIKRLRKILRASIAAAVLMSAGGAVILNNSSDENAQLRAKNNKLLLQGDNPTKSECYTPFMSLQWALTVTEEQLKLDKTANSQDCLNRETSKSYIEALQNVAKRCEKAGLPPIKPEIEADINKKLLEQTCPENKR